MGRRYRLLQDGRTILSDTPGEYAGWAPGRIFGTLDCESGKRMKPENRVFFADLEDAVNEGYRPCMKCRPLDEKAFKRIKRLTPYNTLEEFYRRDE